MTKRAIIVVDLQNEYLPSGKLALVGIDAAVAQAARVIGAARERGELVVHIRHENPDADAPFFVPGSAGVEIIEAVRPTAREQVIVKAHPNAFRDTPLKAALEREGVDAVTIVGAMSHMCIDATARAAADLGYPVSVVHDACATLDLAFEGVSVPAAQAHAANMAALAFGYASVVSAAQWIGDA